MVASIVVVRAQTRYALFFYDCNFKATQMNVKHSLIQEIMFYEFKLGHNTTEAAKNISCVKCEENCNKIVQEIWLSIQELRRSGRWSVVSFDAIEANLVSSNRRVSGKLWFSHYDDLYKSCHICLTLPKYWKTFHSSIVSILQSHAYFDFRSEPLAFIYTVTLSVKE